jgi:Fic-DOC domain mobile mystery protein B
VSDLHEQPDDATPLTAEERDGLIPSHVTLRSELNELEQQNIVDAVAVVFSRRRDPLTEAFAVGLHKRMFGQVWKWAGTYRKTNKNLGVNHWEVQPELLRVFDNVRYWVDNKTYSPDEIALRFHRDIVWVHPFPNGNGRWSRLMADMLAVRLGQSRFSWGNSTLRAPDETRQAYIAALKKADNHDYGPLLAFARS